MEIMTNIIRYWTEIDAAFGADTPTLTLVLEVDKHTTPWSSEYDSSVDIDGAEIAQIVRTVRRYLEDKFCGELISSVRIVPQGVYNPSSEGAVSLDSEQQTDEDTARMEKLGVFLTTVAHAWSASQA
jgi:hypothetical protein